MTEPSSEKDRLEALDQRLKQARQKPVEEPSGASIAFRMGTEMVSGVAVGTGFGWLLDSYLGTMPLFLIILMFIGAAAGVKMMMETSRRYNQTLENEEES